MLAHIHSRPPNIVFIVVIGCALRGALALLPLPFLLARVVPDDTFYYLTIARNVAETGQFSFDNLSATNGFHPLWQLALVPIALLKLSPELSLRIVLILLAVLEGVTIVCTYRIIERLGGSDRAACAGAALYALSSIVLTQAGGANGMETAMASMLLALFLLGVATQNGERNTPVSILKLGSLAALLVLCRLDMAIPVAGILAGLAWLKRVEPGRAGRVVVAGLVPAAVISGMLALNQLQFGDPSPVSAVSIAWMARDYLDVTSWSIVDWGYRIGANLVSTFRLVPFGPVISATTISALGVIGSGALAIMFRYRPQWERTAWGSQWPTLALALGISWAVYILVQTLRMPLLRSWYYGLWLVPTVILAARLLDALAGRDSRAGGRVWLWAGLGVLLISLGYVNALARSGRDASRLMMAEKMETLLPAGSRVGAWNAGTLAFFAPRINVVNLDGVVNNTAWPYIRRRDLGSYMQRSGIDYLADDLGSLAVWKRYWSAGGGRIPVRGARLASVPIPGAADTIVLVRLDTDHRRLPQHP